MPTLPKITRDAPAESGLSVLEKLGLTGGEIAALKRQGFVSAEPRRKNTNAYKLRFRLNGRQQVRYLGCDPAIATVIEQELRILQSAKYTDKKLRALNRESSQLLPACKVRLEPLAEAAGFRFHGRALRSRETLIKSSVIKPIPNPQNSEAYAMEGTPVSLDDNAHHATNSIHNTGVSDNADTCSDPINDTDTMDISDTAKPAAAEPEIDVATTGSDLHQQRICEYMHDSLTKPNAFQAVLGAQTANLMMMAYYQSQALQEALQHGPAAVADLEELERTLEQYIKVTKQIDRFSQTAMKLADRANPQNATLEKIPPRLPAAEPPNEESAS